MRFTLLIPLCLTSLVAFGQHTVIDVPLGNLADLRQQYPDDLDVLGTDSINKTAQIRLNTKYLATIKSHYKTLDASKFTRASLDKYLNPEKLVAAMETLANSYPELATLFDVGETTDGRKIKGLILTAKSKDSSLKPAVLFNGMHHAREVMSTEVPYDIAEYLLKNHATNPEIQEWLDNYQIIIVPKVNPDGNDVVFKTNRWWRKNTYKQNNYVYGVDLNRNYPYLWNTCEGSSGESYSDIYRGIAPASEPEAKAMIALTDKYKPVIDISYHSYSELILYPYGCKNEVNDAKKLYDSIAQEMNNNIIADSGRKGQYKYGNTADTIYEADGGDIDYHWHQNNVISYVIELNSSIQGFQPVYEQWRDKTVANQRGGWMTVLRRMNKGAVKVQLDQSLTNVTYRIKEKIKPQNTDEGESIHTFNFGKNITQRAPRAENLIYQLLPNGEYSIEILKNDEVISTEEFTVNDDLVELYM